MKQAREETRSKVEEHIALLGQRVWPESSVAVRDAVRVEILQGRRNLFWECHAQIAVSTSNA